MNQFSKGFAAGFISLSALIAGYYVLFKPSGKASGDALQTSINQSEPFLQTPAPDRKIQTSDTRKILTAPSPIKKTKSQTNNKTQYTEDEINKVVSKSKQLMTKNKIINKLDQFSQNDLARIEYILDRLNAKLPKELFEEEPIDYQWSAKRQAELEYSYYDKSQLKDIGDLESITCKSQHCQVKVQIPADLKFNPSYVLGWSQPASVSVLDNPVDHSYKTVVIIIARKSQNFSDKIN